MGREADMLIQTPAETTQYMILGFAVILGTMGFFIISLVTRFRSLRQDLEILEEVETSKGYQSS
jgi:hypothetical protein